MTKIMNKEKILELTEYLEFVGDKRLARCMHELVELKNDINLSCFSDKDYENRLFRVALLYNIYHNSLKVLRKVRKEKDTKLPIYDSITMENPICEMRELEIYYEAINKQRPIFKLRIADDYYLESSKPIALRFSNYVLDENKRKERIEEIIRENTPAPIRLDNGNMVSLPLTFSSTELDRLKERENILPDYLKESNECSNMIREWLFKYYGISDEGFDNPYVTYQKEISETRDLTGIDMEYTNEFEVAKMYRYPNDTKHKILAKEYPNDSKPSLIVEKETIYY